MSETFSPLGNLVPSDICAPNKYGLLNFFIQSIAILNSYLIFGEAIGFTLFLPGLVLFYVAFKLVS